jgi:hypothetical protein
MAALNTAIFARCYYLLPVEEQMNELTATLYDTDFYAWTQEQAQQTAWGTTGLDYITFPSACPYSTEQILNQEFRPGA